ncbi:hypothetical protein [Streptoalloteichus hindustanus]|uniref:Uncharacterized protein n=1 Tax=Streptoalloteichus hindustanus TaxID=2017 RepID=A0A1M5LAL8_STRHI|nr:hypothetical protein [Streptoalloteichus hindustanus]SHG62036.1 hypothetical protein SAMN05444320_11144 [Streptoalloteichus hindustanus]
MHDDEGRAIVSRAVREYHEVVPVQLWDLDMLSDRAWRRWRSFSRRHGRRVSHAARVEDLAKGLRDAFEPDPRLVGREMVEYRALAEAVCVALRDAVEASTKDSGAVEGRSVE